MNPGRIPLLEAAAACVLLTSCGNLAGPKPSGRLCVTATTGMIADAARHIAGELADVRELMGPGVDPHLYKATQGDLRRLAGSDLILYNGLHLEGRMGDTFAEMAKRTRVVAVTETIPLRQLRELQGVAGQYDPHVWFDVSLWHIVTLRIRDALIEADPVHRDTYLERAAAYAQELDALRAFCLQRIAEIPPDQRVLITAHDAFGYFGRAYGMEILGVQGISTAAEYGLQDITRLVGVIVKRRIKAVFVESSVSPRSINALIEGARANGHEVRLGGQLYSDAMGAASTPDGTYIGMVRHNVDTIVEALK